MTDDHKRIGYENVHKVTIYILVIQVCFIHCIYTQYRNDYIVIST